MSWFYMLLETYGCSICHSSYWLLRKYFRARAEVTSSSHMELEVAAGRIRQSSIKNTQRFNRNQNGNVVTWQQIPMERNNFNFNQQHPRFRDTASGRSQGMPPWAGEATGRGGGGGGAGRPRGTRKRGHPPEAAAPGHLRRTKSCWGQRLRNTTQAEMVCFCDPHLIHKSIGGCALINSSPTFGLRREHSPVEFSMLLPCPHIFPRVMGRTCWVDDYTCSECNMFAHLGSLRSRFSSWRQSCNISFPLLQPFPLTSTNCSPRSTFFPILQHVSLPSCAHPTPQNLSVCPRGQAHSQKRKNCAVAVASPSSQALLFRSQREGPGISLSNITSNRDSQTFSLMTSGKETSVLVTPPMVWVTFSNLKEIFSSASMKKTENSYKCHQMLIALV